MIPFNNVFFLLFLTNLPKPSNALPMRSKTTRTFLLWNLKGCIYETNGFKSKSNRSEEALDAYDHAARLDPDNIHAWYGKGSTLYQLGRYEDTHTAFDKVLQKYPDNVTVLFRKGLSLRQLERKEEANNIFQKIIELT